MARLSRECFVTEKIDGTNAQVYIVDIGGATIPENRAEASLGSVAVVRNYAIYAGSRNRWITPEADNFGFAAWVQRHADEIVALGEGRHFGEWWGSGIQRGYGLPKGERRFSLFNVNRWGQYRDIAKYPEDRPSCCDVVPVLARGVFSTELVEGALEKLRRMGSFAAPFMNPEGVVVYHTAAGVGFKKTLVDDGQPKGKVA